jgi:hypothetical protein
MLGLGPWGKGGLKKSFYFYFYFYFFIILREECSIAVCAKSVCEQSDFKCLSYGVLTLAQLIRQTGVIGW